MDDKVHLRNLQMNASRIALVVLSLEDFASNILRIAFENNALSEKQIEDIKNLTIAGFKGSEETTKTLSDSETAEIWKSGLAELNQLIDSAIRRARS